MDAPVAWHHDCTHDAISNNGPGALTSPKLLVSVPGMVLRALRSKKGGSPFLKFSFSHVFASFLENII